MATSSSCLAKAECADREFRAYGTRCLESRSRYDVGDRGLTGGRIHNGRILQSHTHPPFLQDEYHDRIVSDGVVVHLENVVQLVAQRDLYSLISLIERNYKHLVAWVNSYQHVLRFLRFGASSMDYLVPESYPLSQLMAQCQYGKSKTSHDSPSSLLVTNLRPERCMLKHNGTIAEFLHKAILSLDRFDHVSFSLRVITADLHTSIGYFCNLVRVETIPTRTINDGSGPHDNRSIPAMSSSDFHELT